MTEKVFDNRVNLTARVTEKDALRHTPAGVPVLNFVLRHDSTQMEAGVARQIDYEIDAVCVGDMARALQDLDLGVVRRFTGFLARKHRAGKQLALHVTQVSQD